MADAYGMLVFTKSKGCEFDAEKLKKVLDWYEWNNQGSQWVYDPKQKEFYFDEYQLQYPTVIPFETISYEVDDGHGSLKTVLSSDMTGDDFENTYDDERAPVPLERLCKEISQTIDKGWIELACTSNEKQRYITFECMRIDSKGNATRQGYMSGTGHHLFEKAKVSKRALNKN